MKSLAGTIYLLAALAVLPLSLLAQQRQWETWKNCRILPDESNDGDSFRVFYQGENHTVRLYLVGTPETSESNRGGPEQVQKQMESFGVSKEAVLHVGRYAKQVTAQMLSRPFTVQTCRQDAMGNSAGGRIAVFVTTVDGKDLGEELLINGLAEVGGFVNAPPGKDPESIRARYRNLQNRARRAKVGIYSLDPARSIKLAGGTDDKFLEESDSERPIQNADQEEDDHLMGPDILPSSPSIAIPTTEITFEEFGARPQSLDAEGGETAEDGRHASDGEASPAEDSGLIDLNSASTEEMETLPGVGKSLAAAIIAARPFQSVEDLLKVRGIGQKRFAQLRELVVVRGTTEKPAGKAPANPELKKPESRKPEAKRLEAVGGNADYSREIIVGLIALFVGGATVAFYFKARSARKPSAHQLRVRPPQPRK